MKEQVKEKISILKQSFMQSLCESDDYFLENMKKKNLAGDPLERYRYWEWPQGVGLYGLWKLYENSQDTSILDEIEAFYQARIEEGLPAKNINTCAPLLALSYLYEVRPEERYREILLEWSEWIMHDLPRTYGGGFQHITSDSQNPEELWDDTLFMTVLVLLRTGIILGNSAYVEEAVFQFLFHCLYLMDRKTGIWFHGFTFLERNHFAAALWGRGNSWITIALPYVLGLDVLSPSERKLLTHVYRYLIDGLVKCQDEETGMWHTLLTDPQSYLEASGTAGIAYGILEGVKQGILDPSYQAIALQPKEQILECIDGNGIVNQVSYGTPMGRDSKDFYKNIPLQPMPYGTSMTLLYLIGVLDT